MDPMDLNDLFDNKVNPVKKVTLFLPLPHTIRAPLHSG